MNSSPSGYFTMIEVPLNEIKAALQAFQNEADQTITDLSGGVGLVNSVFGRSGTVTADVGDYSAFYQPLNAKLTAIGALANAAGLLRNNGSGAFSYDTNTYATQAYADALVIGLLDDRGNYDASGNVFPSSGGSGTAGAIKKGDLWTISVAGTLGSNPVTAGDVVRALADTPGQTDANWAIGENNFGYVALNQALADGKIYVGNGSGIGTAVTPSGDVTMSNAGVTAIGALKVLNSMIANSTIDLTSKVTGILPSANGGTGVNNAGTITNASNTTITGGGTLALAGFTFTIPADGSAAMLNQANNFTLINPLTTIAESWIGPSSTAGVYFKAGNVGVGTVDPTFKLDVQGVGASTLFSVAASSGGTGYAIAQVINAGGVAYVAVDNSTGSSFGAGNYASIFGSSGARPTALITDALPRLTVLHTSGNVGIATASPSYKLDVNGTFRSGGTATFQVDANPLTNYTSNLGSPTNKYLSLNAAELIVETLVAADVRSTVGGRIIVAPTSELTANLAAAGTTITVKHNNLSSGDRIHLESRGQVEFMAVTSGAGGSAGAYTYSVTRNLDGTGANDWLAGDGIVNTRQTGDGLIDLYAAAGMLAGVGPTIVGNVRTGSTYNQMEARWAIGNLNGLYGYGSTTYGAAFGVPGATWIATDATNGFRVMNNTVKEFGVDTSGNVTLGQVATSQGNAYWDNTTKTLQFRGGAAGTVVQAYVDTTGAIVGGGGAVTLDSTGVSIDSGASDANTIKWLNGGFAGSKINGIYTSPDTQLSLVSQSKSGDTAGSAQMSLLTTSFSGSSSLQFHMQSLGSAAGTPNVSYAFMNSGGTMAGFVVGGGGMPNAMLDVRGNGIITGNLTTETGASSLKGTVTIAAPASGRGLVVNSVTDDWAVEILGLNSSTHSFGLTIAAGTTSADKAMRVYAAAYAAELMTIYGDGGVTIGGLANKGAGSIHAVTVWRNGTSLDSVFEPDYKLMSIDAMGEFVKLNHHLPTIPTNQVNVNGSTNMGALTDRLWETTETHALYILQLNERIKAQESQIKELKARIERQ